MEINKKPALFIGPVINLTPEAAFPTLSPEDLKEIAKAWGYSSVVKHTCVAVTASVITFDTKVE